jgi:hypothetical protein
VNYVDGAIVPLTSIPVQGHFWPWAERPSEKMTAQAKSPRRELFSSSRAIAVNSRV